MSTVARPPLFLASKIYARPFTNVKNIRNGPANERTNAHEGSTQEYKFIYEFMTANQWLLVHRYVCCWVCLCLCVIIITIISYCTSGGRARIRAWQRNANINDVISFISHPSVHRSVGRTVRNQNAHTHRV